MHHFAEVAQLAEPVPQKNFSAGSNPAFGTTSRAVSSEAERGSYKPQVGISKFSARTIRKPVRTVRASPDKRVVRGSTPRACTKNADRQRSMQISGSICKSEVKYVDPMQTGAARRRSRSGDRTRRVKPEWRGSGLLTRPQVARNRPGPPFGTSDPSGKGPGLLNRRESYVGSSPTWVTMHCVFLSKRAV